MFLIIIIAIHLLTFDNSLGFDLDIFLAAYSLIGIFLVGMFTIITGEIKLGGDDGDLVKTLGLNNQEILFKILKLKNLIVWLSISMIFSGLYFLFKDNYLWLTKLGLTICIILLFILFLFVLAKLFTLSKILADLNFAKARVNLFVKKELRKIEKNVPKLKEVKLELNQIKYFYDNDNENKENCEIKKELNAESKGWIKEVSSEKINEEIEALKEKIEKRLQKISLAEELNEHYSNKVGEIKKQFKFEKINDAKLKNFIFQLKPSFDFSLNSFDHERKNTVEVNVGQPILYIKFFDKSIKFDDTNFKYLEKEIESTIKKIGKKYIQIDNEHKDSLLDGYIERIEEAAKLMVVNVKKEKLLEDLENIQLHSLETFYRLLEITYNSGFNFRSNSVRNFERDLFFKCPNIALEMNQFANLNLLINLFEKLYRISSKPENLNGYIAKLTISSMLGLIKVQINSLNKKELDFIWTLLGDTEVIGGSLNSLLFFRIQNLPEKEFITLKPFLIDILEPIKITCIQLAYEGRLEESIKLIRITMKTFNKEIFSGNTFSRQDGQKQLKLIKKHNIDYLIFEMFFFTLSFLYSKSIENSNNKREVLSLGNEILTNLIWIKKEQKHINLIEPSWLFDKVLSAFIYKTKGSNFKWNFSLYKDNNIGLWESTNESIKELVPSFLFEILHNKNYFTTVSRATSQTRTFSLNKDEDFEVQFKKNPDFMQKVFRLFKENIDRINKDSEKLSSGETILLNLEASYKQFRIKKVEEAVLDTKKLEEFEKEISKHYKEYKANFLNEFDSILSKKDRKKDPEERGYQIYTFDEYSKEALTKDGGSLDTHYCTSAEIWGEGLGESLLFAFLKEINKSVQKIFTYSKDAQEFIENFSNLINSKHIEKPIILCKNVYLLKPLWKLYDHSTQNIKINNLEIKVIETNFKTLNENEFFLFDGKERIGELILYKDNSNADSIEKELTILIRNPSENKEYFDELFGDEEVWKTKDMDSDQKKSFLRRNLTILLKTSFELQITKSQTLFKIIIDVS